MSGFRDPRIAGISRIADRLAERLRADFSLKLWDGTEVPFSGGAGSDLKFVIRSPAAVRRLMLSPKPETVLELFGSGDFDLEGGTLVEALRRVDHYEAMQALKGLEIGLIVRALWPFLFVRGGRSITQLAYQGRGVARAARDRDDKELVQFHYDVSNDFYSLFLGEEMVYSCAYFARPDMSLDEAQRAKLDMTCRRLRLKPGDRYLDIGCGWGGLICHAAKTYGVNAHGVTLSKQQFDYARERIKVLGLSDSVTVELRDYRELEANGQRFDKISQVELFEHIGLANHDRHFKTIHRLLNPRGLYLHHSITRRLSRDPKKHLRTKGYHDFMRNFVLPGTELDDVGATVAGLERNGFEVHDLENWREHFQKTVGHWAARLTARKDDAVAMLGEESTRLWMLYFTVFELAFERRACMIFQTLASRRGKGGCDVPLTRADLYAPR